MDQLDKELTKIQLLKVPNLPGQLQLHIAFRFGGEVQLAT